MARARGWQGVMHMSNLYSGAGASAKSIQTLQTASSKQQKPGDPNNTNLAEKPDDLLGRYTSRDVIAWLVRCLAPHAGLLLGVFISLLAAIVLQLLVPLFIGRSIDYIFMNLSRAGVSGTGSAPKALPMWLSMLIVCITGGVVFQWISSFWSKKLAYLTAQSIREHAFLMFKRLPVANIDTHAHGDFISRITNDCDAISDGLLQGITQLFSAVCMVVGTIVCIASLSIPMAILVVCLTPLSIVVSYLIAAASAKSFSKVMQLQGEVAASAQEALTHHKLVTAFAQQQRLFDQFKVLNHDLYDVERRAQFVSSLTNPSTRLVNTITYTVVAVFAIFLMLQPATTITVGVLQSFLVYTNQYMKPFNEISAVIGQIQAAFASGRRILDLLDMPQEREQGRQAQEQAGEKPVEMQVKQHSSSAVASQSTHPLICFDNVAFSYTPQQPVLENLSFSVREGQTVALVGKTGCGKTTILNLLLRFYDPDSGRIVLDGRDITNYSCRDLRQQFGMVLQDTWLFKGTVLENLTYSLPLHDACGASAATTSDVTDTTTAIAKTTTGASARANAYRRKSIAVAKAIHAHDFIQQLPQSYDTYLDMEHTQLSEGQKQLICIARVMLAQPRILLLDEATSNIDTRTETYVQQALQTLMASRTAVVVAHRLSTIQNADRILVMDKGRICEQGTHDELLARHGAYEKLYMSQFAFDEKTVALHD